DFIDELKALNVSIVDTTEVAVGQLIFINLIADPNNLGLTILDAEENNKKIQSLSPEQQEKVNGTITLLNLHNCLSQDNFDHLITNAQFAHEINSVLNDPQFRLAIAGFPEMVTALIKNAQHASSLAKAIMHVKKNVKIPWVQYATFLTALAERA